MMVADLEGLLAPTPKARFLAEHWERSHCHLKGRAASFYGSFFSSAELERILFFSKPKPPDLRVVAEQKDLLPDRYVTPEGELNLNQIYKAYDEGHSVIINGLQRYSPGIAALCSQLQREFSHVVIANCYQSPAGSTALLPHYDTHDVFVLQVEGSKTWWLHSPPVEKPLLKSFQPVIPQDSLGDELLKVRLTPGDLLYIPRGVVHRAETTERSSLHVTLGVYPTQWLDLISEALTILGIEDVRFREALPPGYLSGSTPRADLEARLRDLLAALSERGRLDDALVSLEDRLIRKSAAQPDGHFEQLDRQASITLDTPLRRRAGLSTRAIEGWTTAAVQFPGNTIQGPPTFGDAMRFVARAETPFTPRELPSLSDEQRLSLARRLVRGGLLRLAGGESA